MSAKPTPGPWVLDNDGECTIVRDHEGGAIAQLKYLKGRHGLGGRRTAQEVRSYGLMIAAAPELLEALIDIADVINKRKLKSPADCAMLKIANDAIAKATGAAP